jgi:hypothetical protein
LSLQKRKNRAHLHHGLRAEKINWENVAWGVVLAHAPKQAGLASAESLHPSLLTIERSIWGRGEAQESAAAIIAAWRPQFRVVYREVAR